MLFLCIPMKTGRYVHKGTYLLLAAITGWIGLHRFYAKKYITGILYLIFSWTTIPIYLSIVDFFIALIKKKDNYGRIKV